MGKDYRAFTYLAQGVKTYGLLPTNKDTVYQMGYFNPGDKSLVLVSKDTSEELTTFEKIDKFGELEKEKGRQLYERRTLVQNLTFRLFHEDKKWFISEYVMNPDLCSSLEEEYNKPPTEPVAEAEEGLGEDLGIPQPELETETV